MGIKNLLMALSPLTTRVNLTQYRGQVLGIDAMCWMHRGAVASAGSQFLGQTDDKFLKYVMNMIKLLYTFGVKPLLVFDGTHRLPLKAEEEKTRHERRQAAAKEAERLILEKHPIESRLVQSKIQASAHVSPQMIRKLLAALKVARVGFMVAPFESDAQLAYLCKTGVVNAVVTEDSDLLVYGCPRVLFKLNAAGEAQEISLGGILKEGYASEGEKDRSAEKERLVSPDPPLPSSEDQGITDEEDDGTVSTENGSQQSCCEEKSAGVGSNMRCPLLPASVLSSVKSLTSWVKRFDTLDQALNSRKREKLTPPSHRPPCLTESQKLMKQLSQFDLSMFSGMCVLSGCDYSNGLHVTGLGVKKAISLMEKTRRLDSALRLVFQQERLRKTRQLNEREVLLQHSRAYLAFKHHRVYDPTLRRISEMCSLYPRAFPNRLLDAGQEPGALQQEVDLWGNAFNLDEIVGNVTMSEEELQSYVNGETYSRDAPGDDAENQRLSKTPPVQFTKEESSELQAVRRTSMSFEKQQQLREVDQWEQEMQGSKGTLLVPAHPSDVEEIARRRNSNPHPWKSKDRQRDFSSAVPKHQSHKRRLQRASEGSPSVEAREHTPSNPRSGDDKTDDSSQLLADLLKLDRFSACSGADVQTSIALSPSALPPVVAIKKRRPSCVEQQHASDIDLMTRIEFVDGR